MLVTVVTILAWALPASAHAVLESSQPTAGAVLTDPPRQISLHFGEPVEVSLGAIRLFDARGHEISVGPPMHPGGTGSVVSSDVPDLDPGGYVVAWHVVSADSHPVHGAFTFQVGTGAGVTDPNLVANILSSEGGNRTVGVVLGVARFVSYAALAVVVGGIALLVMAWPAGRRSRRARTILWIGVVAGILATAAGIAVQAPYAEGSGLGRMFEPSGWRAVVATRSGRAWEVRLLVFLVAGPILLATIAKLRRRGWQLAAIAAGAVLVIAYAESGHGGVGRAAFPGLIATIAHLGGMSLWIGGLVLLGLAVLPVASATTGVDVARRFSPVAFAAVGVVVASGLVQAWRQVGSFDNVTTTTYGRLLLVKTAIVVVLVGVGALSRRVLQKRLLEWRPEPVPAAVGAAVDVADAAVEPAPDPEAMRRRLRRSVGAEILLAAAVLAVTSLLVATAPAVAVTTGPFNATIVDGSGSPT